ncbi:hypothetical protein ONE63_000509 [Megalurothrips usitatus]|uniref:Uncharacterized protein n=1 Tax=Megalurothrips usitatus TaxID=439358 RepID=A0AAV7Y1Q6_9NEOP|nr:hypothetical protein ONE63_000509 [Megalurothrips usitatus]
MEDEKTALLARAESAAAAAARGSSLQASRTSGYAAIERAESPAAADCGLQNDTRFRAREYARLRRVVLFVTGMTTALVAAGLLVGLLAPVPDPGWAPDEVPVEARPTPFLPVP